MTTIEIHTCCVFVCLE